MKIETLELKLGVRLERQAYRGVINDFEFQVTHISVFGIKSFMISFLVDRSLVAEEIKKIQKTLGFGYTALIGSVVQKNNVVNVNLRNIEKTRLKLVSLVELFKSMALNNLTSDIYGNDAEVNGYKQMTFQYNIQQNYTVQGLYVPVNLEKYNEKHVQLIESIKSEEANNNQILTAIFFAVIGALLGAIPSIILYFLGYMVWLLYILIPLMSFYLYKKGKGPQKSYVPILIGVISFVVGIGSLLYIWNDTALSYGVTLGELFEIEEISTALMSDLLFSIFGNLFGIFASWKYIYSKTNAAKLKDLENVK